MSGRGALVIVNYAQWIPEEDDCTCAGRWRLFDVAVIFVPAKKLDDQVVYAKHYPLIQLLNMANAPGTLTSMRMIITKSSRENCVEFTESRCILSTARS